MLSNRMNCKKLTYKIETTPIKVISKTDLTSIVTYGILICKEQGNNCSIATGQVTFTFDSPEPAIPPGAGAMVLKSFRRHTDPGLATG